MGDLGIGLHEDVPGDVYFADPVSTPSLSQSIAHTLVSKSPLHAWAQHPRLGGRARKPTREMDLGSVVHALLLGKGKRFAVIRAPEGEEEFTDFRKKAAKEARDEARARGLIPLLQHQLDEAVLIAEAIKPRLAEYGIELNGESELTAVWDERDDAGRMVLCRGGLDHFVEQTATIYDLKIVRSAHPKACQSHIVGFGGDIQAAAYVSAIERLRPDLCGRVTFMFLFCEAEFPHAVTPVFRMGSLREYGERRWRRAVNRWSECLRADRWPAYVDAPFGADVPPWAMAAELDLEFSVDNAKPDGPSEARIHRIHGESNGNEHGYDELDGVF